MESDADRAEEFCEALRCASQSGESLRIAGSDSKAFLTRGAGDLQSRPVNRTLDIAAHRGMIDYRPEELVLTARAGTPLRLIEQALAEANQYLPFEPPRFAGGGTLGGAIACGLSGPGRPWRGAVRDAVLGVEMANGCGERLRFGGQVMKNVAGYDVSRLQVGAFGTLGLLLAVSVKVLPRPAAEQTRVFELDARAALERCRAWARRPHPISATCYLDGRLRVRLSGAAPAVEEAAVQLGGEEESDARFWEALRDHRLPFLADAASESGSGLDSRDAAGRLWRCSMPPAAEVPLDDCLVSWAGAERWWRPGPEPSATLSAIAAAGGSARPFDGRFGLRDHGLTAAEMVYSARLREAFDPAGVLNPELAPRAPQRELQRAD
jgi:glycolate oxidase FAD binding subunit